MTREEKLAYGKGYVAGSRRRWPAHKPPLPDDATLRKCLEAMRALRDAADAGCATFDKDDPFCQAMYPGIDAVDAAMEELTRWLKGKTE